MRGVIYREYECLLFFKPAWNPLEPLCSSSANPSATLLEPFSKSSGTLLEPLWNPLEPLCNFIGTLLGPSGTLLESFWN